MQTWKIRFTALASLATISSYATAQSNGPVEPLTAKPLNGPGGWIAANDYPAAALRAGQQGVVGVKLFIDQTGRVAACTITQTSHSGELDAATCELIKRRARFAPHGLAPGAQFAGVFTTTAKWALPVESSSLPSINDAMNASKRYPMAAKGLGGVGILYSDGHTYCAVVVPIGQRAARQGIAFSWNRREDAKMIDVYGGDIFLDSMFTPQDISLHIESLGENGHKSGIEKLSARRSFILGPNVGSFGFPLPEGSWADILAEKSPRRISLILRSRDGAYGIQRMLPYGSQYLELLKCRADALTRDG